jgi:integrase
MEQLNDRLVRALPLAERGQYIKRDTLAGFFVVVGRRAKTFTIQTDVHGLGERKTVRRMLGRFPDIKCDEARAKAKLVLGQYQTGERKLTAAPDVTLRAAWVEYRHDMTVKARSARTIALYDDTVTRVLRDWLDVPFAELGEPANRALVRAKHKEFTQRHGPYAANRALETLRAVYNHAARIYPLPPNPCIAVSYNKESRRDTGMGPSDLAAWFKQLAALPNPVRREFHLLLLLSGSRAGAMKRARWEHLNVKRRALRIPAPKGGAERAFDIPLSRHMLVALNRAKRAGRVLHPELAREWIFPAATSTGHIAEHKEKRRVLDKYGHDLRHSFATLAAAVGVNKLFIKLLLNHKLSSDVTDGYITGGALFEQLRAEQVRLSRFIMGHRET